MLIQFHIIVFGSIWSLRQTRKGS